MKRYKLSSIATAIALDPNAPEKKKSAAGHLLRDILAVKGDSFAQRVAMLSYTVSDMLGVVPPRLHESDADFTERIAKRAVKIAKAYGLEMEEVGDAK